MIDGPLRGPKLPRALGYVKTHRVQYLPPELTTLVGQLGSASAARFPARHDLAPLHLVLETSRPARFTLVRRGPGRVLGRSAPHEAIRLADVSAVTLPRFASSPYKDPRAPQNLTPIAGLERRLRGMLGDQRYCSSLSPRRPPGAAAAAQLPPGA